MHDYLHNWIVTNLCGRSAASDKTRWKCFSDAPY